MPQIESELPEVVSQHVLASPSTMSLAIAHASSLSFAGPVAPVVRSDVRMQSADFSVRAMPGITAVRLRFDPLGFTNGCRTALERRHARNSHAHAAIRIHNARTRCIRTRSHASAPHAAIFHTHCSRTFLTRCTTRPQSLRGPRQVLPRGRAEARPRRDARGARLRRRRALPPAVGRQRRRAVVHRVAGDAAAGLDAARRPRDRDPRAHVGLHVQQLLRRRDLLDPLRLRERRPRLGPARPQADGRRRAQGDADRRRSTTAASR